MTDNDCISPKEFGELHAQVTQLQKETSMLFTYLKDHMEKEETKFTQLNDNLTELKLIVAKYIGGGIALMIISDWLIRSGAAHL